MMMVSNRLLFLVLFFALFAGFASSSSCISYDALGSHGSTGRSLLQQKGDCPIDFENQNYTIITSQCKGPNYNGTTCCQSFKQLACPYSEAINDLTNNCATTLFSYINLYGKYPPGLFSSLCREGKEGLDCSTVLKDALANNSTQNSDAPPKLTQPLLLLAMSTFLLLPLNLY